MNPIEPEMVADIDQLILRHYAWLLMIVIGVVAFKIWEKRLDRLSVFKGTNGFEAVAILMFQKLGYRRGPRAIGSDLVFRPTIGLILSFPLFGVAIWYVSDMLAADASIGLVDDPFAAWFPVVAWSALAYAFIWTTFFSRVEITQAQIGATNWYGGMRWADRADLMRIEAGSRDHTYIAHFKGGRKIRFARTMSRREELLALLHDQIRANMRGAELQLPNTALG